MKKGNTGKLEVIGYRTSDLLEVELKSGNWARVTYRDFRSYNGNRRTTGPDSVVHGDPFRNLVTVPYEGAYYFFDTNSMYTPENYEKHTIVSSIKDCKKSLHTK